MYHFYYLKKRRRKKKNRKEKKLICKLYICIPVFWFYLVHQLLIGWGAQSITLHLYDDDDDDDDDDDNIIMNKQSKK
jgi:hypothetical protein